MGKKPSNPEPDDKDLAHLRTTLKQMDTRLRQIEHDCGLFALKESIIDLLGRVSQLEDDRHRRQQPEA